MTEFSLRPNRRGHSFVLESRLPSKHADIHTYIHRSVPTLPSYRQLAGPFNQEAQTIRSAHQRSERTIDINSDLELVCWILHTRHPIRYCCRKTEDQFKTKYLHLTRRNGRRNFHARGQNKQIKPSLSSQPSSDFIPAGPQLPIQVPQTDEIPALLRYPTESTNTISLFLSSVLDPIN